MTTVYLSLNLSGFLIKGIEKLALTKDWAYPFCYQPNLCYQRNCAYQEIVLSEIVFQSLVDARGTPVTDLLPPRHNE